MRPVCVTKKPEKERKTKDRNLTLANCVFAETTHVVGSKWNFAWILRGGWSLYGILRFEFRQNRFSGFGAVEVEICPFPLIWSLAYTTVCTTVQAVIKWLHLLNGAEMLLLHTRHRKWYCLSNGAISDDRGWQLHGHSPIASLFEIGFFVGLQLCSS